MMVAQTEILNTARFEKIRYAQCWEDADVLLEAIRPNFSGTYLSVAAAGDNALALVGKGAGRVIAVDINPAQIACLELRVAAYRSLTHPEFLQLMGQSECGDRGALYRRCREHLSSVSVSFWDAHVDLIQHGVAQVGKFESYLDLFRRFLLPVTQSPKTMGQLFSLDSERGRKALFEQHWNNRRWRFLCRLFFSRPSLGRFGRDPEFTRYADESVWSSLERRLPHALVVQDPRKNPYLQRILTGRFQQALPWAWRAENFDRIRDNLDALEWSCESIESVLKKLPPDSVNGFNLSDIFEYMSASSYEQLLQELIRVGSPACRLVYWNVVVNRSRPKRLAHSLRSLRDVANSLYATDKAFFYRDLVVEEVV